MRHLISRQIISLTFRSLVWYAISYQFRCALSLAEKMNSINDVPIEENIVLTRNRFILLRSLKIGGSLEIFCKLEFTKKMAHKSNVSLSIKSTVKYRFRNIVHWSNAVLFFFFRKIYRTKLSSCCVGCVIMNYECSHLNAGFLPTFYTRKEWINLIF